MPEVSVDYYGVTGKGKNVTEAKRDAGEQIRKALDGDYTPVLVHWREYTVLMARDPKSGWGYRISHPEEHGIFQAMYLNTGWSSRDECLLALVKHIAGIARPTNEDPKLSLPFFQDSRLRGPALEAYKQFADDCRQNDKFQRRYRHAIDDLKMEEWQARDFAFMSPATYESWKGTEHMFATPAWEEQV